MLTGKFLPRSFRKPKRSWGAANRWFPWTPEFCVRVGTFNGLKWIETGYKSPLAMVGQLRLMPWPYMRI